MNKQIQHNGNPVHDHLANAYAVCEEEQTALYIRNAIARTKEGGDILGDIAKALHYNESWAVNVFLCEALQASGSAR